MKYLKLVILLLALMPLSNLLAQNTPDSGRGLWQLKASTTTGTDTETVDPSIVYPQ